MKDIIIIIIILILILLFALFIRNYLKKTTFNLVSKLNELEDNILKLKEDDSREIIIKQIEDTKENWDKTEEGWALIILHGEMDAIETSFLKLEANIKYGELQNALEELANARFLVQHIYEKEKFNLKNIF